MHLGEFIKQYRIKHKMSMGDFARLSGISKAYVSVLEKNRDPRNDKPITPSIHIIKKVSDTLEIPFDELFNQLDDDIIVSFIEPSNKKITNNTKLTTLSSNSQLLVDTYNQLNEPRQENVLNYAKQQLNEQSHDNIIDFNSIKEKTHKYNSSDDEYDDVDVYGGISAGTGLDLYDEVIETIRYPKPVPIHDIALRVHGDSMEPTFRDKEIVFIKKTTEIYHGQIGAFIVNGMGLLKKFYREKDSIRLVSLNRNYKDIVIGEDDDVRLVGTVIL